MTERSKSWCRQRVRDEGYTIIWPAGEMPCEFLDERVNLIYEDMDGEPCISEAIYTYDRRESDLEHKPYFERVSDGAKMVNCLAWKKI